MSAILIGLVAMQAVDALPPVTSAMPAPPIAVPQVSPVPAAPMQHGTPPTPRGAPQTWVTGDDYPAAALRAGESGAVGFTLTIDKAGAVVACGVTRSSGSVTLDTTTCNLMRERATFNPARDERGRAVAGLWSSRFRWELPEPDPVPDTAATPPPPLIPWGSITRFVIGTDGTIGACETRIYAPGSVTVDEICQALRRDDPAKLIALRGHASGPVTIMFHAEQRVGGMPDVDIPPVPAGFRAIVEARSTFDVTESGERENCEPGGLLTITPCSIQQRFAPGPSRRSVIATTAIVTDGDPDVMAALMALNAEPN